MEDCQRWNDQYSVPSTTAEQAQQRQKELREDSRCGSLWLGRSHTEKLPPFLPRGSIIQLVVAHCNNHDLSWLDDLLDMFQERHGYRVKLDIYSKCGKQDQITNQAALFSKVNTNQTTLSVLPNVGGCDHTYAHWLATHHPDVDTSSTTDDTDFDYVIFLKDTFRGHVHRIVQTLLKAGSGGHDFGCGADPPAPPIPLNVTMMDTKDSAALPGEDGFVLPPRQLGWATYSSIHSTKHLHRFNMANYKRTSDRLGLVDDNETEQEQEEDVPFKSPHDTMYDFMSNALQIHGGWPTPLANVCYTGLFAASKRGVQRTSPEVFERVRTSLERGNNIEEGHFVERLWASFFQKPLSAEEMEAITEHFAGGVVLLLPGQTGMLTRMI